MPITKIHLTIAAAAGILLTATALRPQVPPVGPVWEYSSVAMTSPGGATICYATDAGCRSEKVGAAYRQPDDSLMNAAMRLGQKGWELTAVTDGAGDPKSGRTLYFRRLQSVLTKAEAR